MDPVLIVAAFILGSMASRIGLPPLVGYLVAGFLLNGMGVEAGEHLAPIADAGVTLLLFSIGLKLKLKDLAYAEVWAGTTVHMLVAVVFFSAGLGLLSLAGMPMVDGMGWSHRLLVAFALSFSSTVFAVTVFEAKKEMASRHAVTAIGILIMQDIIAVIFLAVSSGKVPSIWALALIGGMFLIRPLLMGFLSRCGHGELLMLFGILMPFAGYSGFELVGLKGDLGALAVGMLVAAHPKAQELAGALLGFKDLFLVGFFLNIGINGSPSMAAVGMALVLTIVMPVKAVLFFGVLTRFKMRARTSLLVSLSLANYSEFGLIVGSIGVALGWLDSGWLVVLAIALALSFMLAAPANSMAHGLYARWAKRLKPFESGKRRPDGVSPNLGEATIAVIGLGGLGTAAFDEMHRRHGNVVVGIDFSRQTVQAHQKNGRWVMLGDAADSDFWEKADPAHTSIRMVMLTLPDAQASAFAIQQLQARGYGGQITASVRYQDEVDELKLAGIDAAYVMYQEAGVGFADYVCKYMDHCQLQEPGLNS